MEALLNTLVRVENIRVTILFALCALLVIAGPSSVSTASRERPVLRLRAMIMHS